MPSTYYTSLQPERKKMSLFKGKETYKEELNEAKAIKSGKISPKQYASGEESEKKMKKMAIGGTTTKRIIKKSTGGMYGIPQENLGTSGQYGFAKKGGSTGTHKMPNGKVMLNSKMKTGGATKATKFAALAPPYDKATFADKIVGAKKSAGSKKLPKAQLGGILKMVIRATKPLAKTLKPIAKKIVSKSKTTATKKFNYPKDKVKSMFPRVTEDVKKFNSETNSQKLFEKKTIKEQMKQWDKAAELKQQKKYPVLKNKN